MLNDNYAKQDIEHPSVDHGYDFDLLADDYKNLASDRVKISGGDSSYFAEYKIIEVKKNVPTHLTKSDIILDVGCGIGLSSPYFERYFPESEIIGIDISKKSIHIAQKNNSSRNVKYMVYNGSHFPFEDQSLSIAFCSGIFHHIVSDKIRKSLISEMYRTLKKGGHMFIFEHNPNNIFTRIIANNPEDKAGRLVPIKEMARLVRTFPFHDINVINTLFFPRHKLFQRLLPLETRLKNLPLGGQYYVMAKK